MRPGAITIFEKRVDTSMLPATSATVAQAIEHDDGQALVTGSQHFLTGKVCPLSMSIPAIAASVAMSHGVIAAAPPKGATARDSSVMKARISFGTDELCQNDRDCPVSSSRASVVKAFNKFDKVVE